MAKSASRNLPHIIEELAVDVVSKSVHAVRGELLGLCRRVSGRDYGIDAIIELFENGDPTGKVALIQIKGTEQGIEPLINSPRFVSVNNFSRSNLHYALQDRIPIVLIYANVEKSEEYYYFQIVQTGPKKPAELLKLDQETVTIHLSANNYVDYDATALLHSINNYYENKSAFLVAP